MKLKFAVAAVLAASSMATMAADRTVTLEADGTTHFDSLATANDGLFSGGLDVFTFTGPATTGLYDVTISLAGTNVFFDGRNTTLNGVKATKFNGESPISDKLTFSFMGLASTTTAPFTLNLFGGLANSSPALYSGNITVTSVSAVPEPTTYGMLLGGLGIMGFLARRKSKQA